jgi:hypothetical protein
MTIWLYTESAASTSHAFFTARYFEVLKSLRPTVTQNVVFCCVVAKVLMETVALLTLKI